MDSRAAGLSGGFPRSAKELSATLLGRTLGRVVAHEIGHVSARRSARTRRPDEAAVRSRRSTAFETSNGSPRLAQAARLRMPLDFPGIPFYGL
jgi:predicted Zn-dependent protease